MSRAIPLLATGCLGLLLSPAAPADSWYSTGGSSAPLVRLGVDVIWGGGYAYGPPPPPPPPVVWYPAPVYGYAPPPRYVAPPRYVYGPPPGRGWRKHRHRDWERCDD